MSIIMIVVLYVEDGVVKVKWSCGHEGHLQVDWLKEHCYSKHSLDTATKNGKPISIASVSTKIVQLRCSLGYVP